VPVVDVVEVHVRDEDRLDLIGAHAGLVEHDVGASKS